MRDEAQIRRFADLARRAEKSGRSQWTRFLSPAEQELARIEARREGVELYTFGGAESAERRMCAFSPEETDAEEKIGCVKISWDHRYAKIGHRDLLGSVLALGMEREHFGDIYLQEDCAYLFLTREMAKILPGQLSRVGNASVDVEECEIPEELKQNSAGEEIRATVASLRLDAVLGSGFRLSRGNAAEVIRQGRVQLNYVLEMRPDRQVPEGAVISVRGMGRCVLGEIGGQTKKGRISIVLLRY